MLFAKFGCNWPSGSGEDKKMKINVESLQTDGQQTTGNHKRSLEH